jgi:hypothetical protein
LISCEIARCDIDLGWPRHNADGQQEYPWVMAAQKDLRTLLGEFTPKFVSMALSGGRPAD